MKKPVIIALIVLLVDQISKIWIKTNMILGEEHVIASWFRIHFTENNGMAFGLELQGEFGKLALSLFRIIAVSGIGYYLWYCVKHKMHPLFITALSLIFAGALGNIIDSAFYGMLFSDSDSFEPAKFLPAEGGYATFLHGRVVDMLYFPLIRGTYPQWFPLWGGEYFEFFRPVFNISDSSISIGVFMILIFQKRMFAEPNQTVSAIVSTPEIQNETESTAVTKTEENGNEPETKTN